MKTRGHDCGPLPHGVDPFPDVPGLDRRKYHMAAHFLDDGSVSALCFRRPRAINLRRALWTIRKSAVTCPKCLRKLKAARKNTAAP